MLLYNSNDQKLFTRTYFKLQATAKESKNKRRTWLSHQSWKKIITAKKQDRKEKCGEKQEWSRNSNWKLKSYLSRGSENDKTNKSLFYINGVWHSIATWKTNLSNVPLYGFSAVSIEFIVLFGISKNKCKSKRTLLSQPIFNYIDWQNSSFERVLPTTKRANFNDSWHSKKLKENKLSTNEMQRWISANFLSFENKKRVSKYGVYNLISLTYCRAWLYYPFHQDYSLRCICKSRSHLGRPIWCEASCQFCKCSR